MADEARLHELLDIYEQAQKEGDTATAQAVMNQYHKETDEVSSRTAARARPVTNDPATWPKDASGQPVNPNAPAAGPAPTGIYGPRTVAAGLASPFFGPGQLVTAGAEAVGLASPGATADYTGAVNDIQSKIAGHPLSPDEQAAVQGFGMLASSAVPVGAVGKAAHVIDAAAKVKPVAIAAKLAGAGAAGGAVAGATNFNPGAQDAWEPLVSEALGVATGTGISTALALVPTAKNALVKLMSSPPTPESAKRLQEMLNSPRFATAKENLTIAQETGRHEAEVQHARVAGTLAGNRYNQQLDDLNNRFIAGVKQPGMTAQDMALATQKAINRTRAQIQAKASEEYGSTVEQAKALARTDPAYQWGMKADNTTQALADAQATGGDWASLMGSAAGKYARQIQDTLDRIATGGGRMGMDDLITLHQASTRMRAGLQKAGLGRDMTSAEFAANRLGKQIGDAIEKDVAIVDAKVQQAQKASQGQPAMQGQQIPGQASMQAWDKFQQARAGYRDFIDARNSLNSTAAAQIFGIVPKDAEEAWRMILRREPAEQARLFNILRQQQPEMLTELKRWKLHDVANRMFQQTEAGAKAAISPDQFINELTEGNRLVGENMWSEAEKAHIRAGIAYARAIENKSNLANRGTEPKRAIMAIGSGARAFLIGNLYDIAASGQLEKLLFTPEGKKMMRTLATGNPKAPSYAASAALLESWARNGRAANPQAAQQEQPSTFEF